MPGSSSRYGVDAAAPTARPVLARPRSAAARRPAARRRRSRRSSAPRRQPTPTVEPSIRSTPASTSSAPSRPNVCAGSQAGRPRPRAQRPAGADVLREDHQLLAPRHPHEVLGADPGEAGVGRRRRPAGRCGPLDAPSSPAARAGSSPAGRRPAGRRSPLAAGRAGIGELLAAARRAPGRRRPCPDTRRADQVGLAEEVGDERRASGARRARPGRPSARSGPAFMTAMVSAMVMASSWSWVTCTNVRPTSVWIRLSSICIWRRSLRSRAPSGSSSSSTAGRLTIARASATRCCWPPESWAGLRRASSAELDQLERLARPAPSPSCCRGGAGRTRRSRRCRGAGTARSSGRRC